MIANIRTVARACATGDWSANGGLSWLCSYLALVVVVGLVLTWLTPSPKPPEYP